MSAPDPARGRGPAADLLARLRPIWPEPTDLRISRSSRRRPADGEAFLVLPALRKPVLLVPADRPGAAGAIRRVDEGQRARLSLRLLARAQAHGLLRRAPVVRVVVGAQDRPGVVQVLRDAIPGIDSVVVRLGRRRHGRAVVLQALDAEGRSVAFAKCAWGRGIAGLRTEHASLVEVAEDRIPGVRAPEVLAFEATDDFAVLVLEALVPASAATGTGVPVAAMQSLAGWQGWQHTTVADSEVVRRLGKGVAAVADPAARAWLSTELHRMVAELGDVPTRTGRWHGDWVPWNMARDGSRVLLWDWEHQEPGALPGFDELHYLAQELRQGPGTGPDVEDTWVEAARPALAQHWDVSGPEAEAAIRAYLLVVNLRFVGDREGDPHGPVDRAGWSRSLLERLGGTVPGSTR